MRPATITKALAALPCTRAELAAKLQVSRVWADDIAEHLVRERYAETWGGKLNERGTLEPVLQATGKLPCC